MLFVLTATSAATVLPTIRSRCAAYTIAPVPTDECAALLTREGLPARLAQELAFCTRGHIGTALQAFRNDTFKAALGAQELCSYAAQNDTYRTLVLVTSTSVTARAFWPCCGSWISCAVRCCAAPPMGLSSAAA